eukprot:204779-Chlamydomonas_euryale.AAC.1
MSESRWSAQGWQRACMLAAAVRLGGGTALSPARGGVAFGEGRQGMADDITAPHKLTGAPPTPHTDAFPPSPPGTRLLLPHTCNSCISDLVPSAGIAAGASCPLYDQRDAAPQGGSGPPHGGAAPLHEGAGLPPGGAPLGNAARARSANATSGPCSMPPRSRKLSGRGGAPRPRPLSHPPPAPPASPPWRAENPPHSGESAANTFPAEPERGALPSGACPSTTPAMPRGGGGGGGGGGSCGTDGGRGDRGVALATSLASVMSGPGWPRGEVRSDGICVPAPLSSAAVAAPPVDVVAPPPPPAA